MSWRELRRPVLGVLLAVAVCAVLVAPLVGLLHVEDCHGDDRGGHELDPCSLCDLALLACSADFLRPPLTADAQPDTSFVAPVRASVREAADLRIAAARGPPVPSSRV